MSDIVVGAAGSLARFLVQILFYTIAYWTAKLVVPILTFGRCYVSEREVSGSFIGWPFWKRKPNGKLYFGCEVGSFIGFVIWGLALAFLAGR